jgi:hypothetical protein
MARALEAAEEWRENAYLQIQFLARARRPFTSEDVVAAVGLPAGGVRTNRNNAVGAVMNGAAKRGWIVKTGRRVTAKRKQLHAAELTEWTGAGA